MAWQIALLTAGFICAVAIPMVMHRHMTSWIPFLIVAATGIQASAWIKAKYSVALPWEPYAGSILAFALAHSLFVMSMISAIFLAKKLRKVENP